MASDLEPRGGALEAAEAARAAPPVPNRRVQSTSCSTRSTAGLAAASFSHDCRLRPVLSTPCAAARSTPRLAVTPRTEGSSRSRYLEDLVEKSRDECDEP
jgi:hypothetical protein